LHILYRENMEYVWAGKEHILVEYEEHIVEQGLKGAKLVEQVIVKCRVCKRKLTNPKSLERGLGRVCYKKWEEGYRGIQIIHNEDIGDLKKKLVRRKK